MESFLTSSELTFMVAVFFVCATLVSISIVKTVKNQSLDQQDKTHRIILIASGEMVILVAAFVIIKTLHIF